MTQGLWLEPTKGPSPQAVLTRVRFWEEREDALRASGPLALLDDSGPRPPESHGRLDTYLPIATLRRDVHSLLQLWFEPALASLNVDLDEGHLARARSVLEARAWLPTLRGAKGKRLPSDLLRDVGEHARAAHDFLFELFAPPRLGSVLGRYPQRLSAIVAAAPTETVRVWDAGCATGEWTWELALALALAREVEALGTTPWPLERLMAERRGRPHDPAAGEALRAFVDARCACNVTFALGDVARGHPQGAFDVVTCHGVLGGVLANQAAVSAALQNLCEALAPGGLLSVTDCFREDLSRQAAGWVSAKAERLGLETLEPGLFRRHDSARLET